MYIPLWTLQCNGLLRLRRTSTGGAARFFETSSGRVAFFSLGVGARVSARETLMWVLPPIKMCETRSGRLRQRIPSHVIIYFFGRLIAVPGSPGRSFTRLGNSIAVWVKRMRDTSMFFAHGNSLIERPILLVSTSSVIQSTNSHRNMSVIKPTFHFPYHSFGLKHARIGAVLS